MRFLGYTIFERTPVARTRKSKGPWSMPRYSAGATPELSSLFSATYAKRGYKGAKLDRLTADLASMSGSANSDILTAHTRLVAISRDLSNNSDYAKRYFNIIIRNVVGDEGIKFQSKVKNKNGKALDDHANEKIEASFKEWSKKGNCTVCGKYSYRDVQRLVELSQARDGEILIRKVHGFPNKWGFALQVLEADHLDINFGNGKHTLGATTGNTITMSVESNNWNRPVAYHLLTSHPGDNVFFGADGLHRLRVPADDLLHIYVIERAGQVRGVPHICASMLRLNHLTSYEETELIAARVAASKMGFYMKEGEAGASVDGEDEKGNPIQNAEPGVFEELEPGVTFKEYNPTHPSGAYAAFMERALRGIASGLDVPYSDLANDLKSVNFSSIRAGIIDARTTWLMKQHDQNDKLNDPVYESWLKMALMTDLKGKLTVSQYARYVAGARWQGRAFPYINPVQDIKADLLKLRNGLTTFTKLAAANGTDYAENIIQLAKELNLAKSANINFPIGEESDSDLNNEVNTDVNK